MIRTNNDFQSMSLGKNVLLIPHDERVLCLVAYLLCLVVSIAESTDGTQFTSDEGIDGRIVVRIVLVIIRCALARPSS
jgi:hypothetical protein